MNPRPASLHALQIVNAGVIADGHPALRDPLALGPLFAASDALARLRARSAAARPAPVPELRLVPLGDFAWAGPRDCPRTRGDHALLWVTRGGARLRLPSHTSDAGAGALRFLPAGTAFATTPVAGTEGVALLIGRAVVAAGGSLPVAPVMAELDEDAALALHADLAALMAEALGGGPGARRAVALRLGLLAQRLTRLADAAEGARLAPTRLAERFVALAVRDLGPERTIGDMAADLGVTAADIDRACRARSGRSALDTLARLRIDRALDLLRATDRPLAIVAREAGFAGRAHMARALAAATGQPLEAYRRR